MPESFWTWAQLKTGVSLYQRMIRMVGPSLIFWTFLLLKKIVTSLKISEVIFSVSWTSIGVHQFILGGLYKKKLLILKLSSEMYFQITHYPFYDDSWEKFPTDLATKNRYSSEQSVFILWTLNYITDHIIFT